MILLVLDQFFEGVRFVGRLGAEDFDPKNVPEIFAEN